MASSNASKKSLSDPIGMSSRFYNKINGVRNCSENFSTGRCEPKCHLQNMNRKYSQALGESYCSRPINNASNGLGKSLNNIDESMKKVCNTNVKEPIYRSRLLTVRETKASTLRKTALQMKLSLTEDNAQDAEKRCNVKSPCRKHKHKIKSPQKNEAKIESIPKTYKEKMKTPKEKVSRNGDEYKERVGKKIEMYSGDNISMTFNSLSSTAEIVGEIQPHISNTLKQVDILSFCRNADAVSSMSCVQNVNVSSKSCSLHAAADKNGVIFDEIEEYRKNDSITCDETCSDSSMVASLVGKKTEILDEIEQNVSLLLEKCLLEAENFILGESSVATNSELKTFFENTNSTANIKPDHDQDISIYEFSRVNNNLENTKDSYNTSKSNKRKIKPDHDQDNSIYEFSRMNNNLENRKDSYNTSKSNKRKSVNNLIYSAQNKNRTKAHRVHFKSLPSKSKKRLSHRSWNSSTSLTNLNSEEIKCPSPSGVTKDIALDPCVNRSGVISEIPSNIINSNEMSSEISLNVSTLNEAFFTDSCNIVNTSKFLNCCCTGTSNPQPLEVWKIPGVKRVGRECDLPQTGEGAAVKRQVEPLKTILERYFEDRVRSDAASFWKVQLKLFFQLKYKFSRNKKTVRKWKYFEKPVVQYFPRGSSTETVQFPFSKANTCNENIAVSDTRQSQANESGEMYDHESEDEQVDEVEHTGVMSTLTELSVTNNPSNFDDAFLRPEDYSLEAERREENSQSTTTGQYSFLDILFILILIIFPIVYIVTTFCIHSDRCEEFYWQFLKFCYYAKRYFLKMKF